MSLEELLVDGVVLPVDLLHLRYGAHLAIGRLQMPE